MKHCFYSLEFLAQSRIHNEFFQYHTVGAHGGKPREYLSDHLKDINVYLREGASWSKIEDYNSDAIRPMKINDHQMVLKAMNPTRKEVYHMAIMKLYLCQNLKDKDYIMEGTYRTIVDEYMK